MAKNSQGFWSYPDATDARLRVGDRINDGSGWVIIDRFDKVKLGKSNNTTAVVIFTNGNRIELEYLAARLRSQPNLPHDGNYRHVFAWTRGAESSDRTPMMRMAKKPDADGPSPAELAATSRFPVAEPFDDFEQYPDHDDTATNAELS